MKKVSIIGIGRIGLPMALCFADAGCKVIGVDIDKEKLSKLEKKVMPFMEEGAQELLDKYMHNGFEVSDDIKYGLQNSEYIVMTLGTPVDEHLNPNFSQIETVLKEAIPAIKKDHVFILRSTVNPGGTKYVKYYLEKNTSFKVGKDIYLAFCPERIAEGYAIQETKEIPTIIGANDEKSKEKAKELFELINKDILLTDSTSAELAKLFCNMYRYINFAIPNEFMYIANQYGCNIYEVRELVNHNYKRGGLAQPGFAAGPCLFKDGNFVINKVIFPDMITCSWKINESLPAQLIEEIERKKELMGEKVALLGLAFKKDIDDDRNSLSHKAKKIFRREGADLHMHDPYITEKSENLEDVLKDAGIVYIGINHSQYKEMGLDYLKKYVKKDCVVCDVFDVFKTGKVVFDINYKNEKK